LSILFFRLISAILNKYKYYKRVGILKMEIEKNISLKNKNWFRTGGNAAFFCQPENKQEFQQALEYAKNNSLTVDIMGLGANILVNDAGVDGLVIRPALRKIELLREEKGDAFIQAGAGVTIHQLIEWCLDNNMTGLEEFSAIPGTVGGSVYNNLHYFKYAFSDFLVSGEVINKKTGIFESIDKEWFGFGYDKSTLHSGEYFLVNAVFKVKKGTEIDAAFARGRRVEIIRHRLARYPGSRTCGCFFKNFDISDIDFEIEGKKIIHVGYYFDKLGYKGKLQVGGAGVSHQHANMIVTNDEATSSDIIGLARKMQEGVKKEFGLIPQPECCFLGFKDNPLL